MLRVHPFNAYRPQPNRAPHVASVPYDVVSTAEARELARDEPDSFLHVIRPEIGLPDETGAYDDVVYDRALENLERLIADGVLVREDGPTMYLYRQVLDHQSQIGLVCCCHIEDYLNNVIKKHEKTRQDKEDDRTRHVLTLRANTGPVFLTYRDDEDIDQLVAEDVNDRPLIHFNAPDGVTHTVWTVSDPARYVEAFRKVPAAYVADGHHRSASAARAGAELARTGEAPESSQWFMCVLFPASQLTILSYNRVVADLNGLSRDEVMTRLAEAGELSPTDAPTPTNAGEVCIYMGDGWHRLRFADEDVNSGDPIRSLDVSILQDRILNPILGVGDPRTDTRIGFVGGIRGTTDLERRVDSGEAAFAVSMYPTSIEQLLAVSDADLVMPPKSTWFEPKLRSGLFVHRLD